MTRTSNETPIPPAGHAAGTPRTPRLVLVGLGAQLVGVSVQAVFHLGGSAVAPVLTESRASLIDHVVSNLGVACLAWQTARWLRAGTAWWPPARRLIVAGAGLQVAGALADGASHLAGAEQPAAFAALGLGYLLAVTGVAVTVLNGPRRRTDRR